MNQVQTVFNTRACFVVFETKNEPPVLIYNKLGDGSICQKKSIENKQQLWYKKPSRKKFEPLLRSGLIWENFNTCQILTRFDPQWYSWVQCDVSSVISQSDAWLHAYWKSRKVQCSWDKFREHVFWFGQFETTDELFFSFYELITNAVDQFKLPSLIQNSGVIARFSRKDFTWLGSVLEDETLVNILSLLPNSAKW